MPGALSLSCAKTAEVRAPTLQTRTGDQGRPAADLPELTSLTETLADTYVIAIADGIDAMQPNKRSADARSQAQRVKVFVGTTAYSLATNPNPEIAMIDLAVNISIQHAIFKGGLAEQYFGDAGEPLVKAYARTEEQAWTTLARVFTPSQLSLLHDGIERWLADNPHTLQFVRAPSLAKYRDVSPVTSPGSIRLTGSRRRSRARHDGATAPGRAFALSRPAIPLTLINWHTKQVLFDTLETPEFREMLHSTATFASTSERLAKVIDEMPDSELCDRRSADLRATLTESSSLLQNLRGVVAEMNQTIGGTDRVLAPFQTPAPAVGGGPPERRFDVAQYTELMRELGKTVAGMNELLGNGHALVTSPELSGKLNEAGRGGRPRGRASRPLD